LAEEVPDSPGMELNLLKPFINKDYAQELVSPGRESIKPFVGTPHKDAVAPLATALFYSLMKNRLSNFKLSLFQFDKLFDMHGV
jgi:hypothetical protein